MRCATAVLVVDVQVAEVIARHNAVLPMLAHPSLCIDARAGAAIRLDGEH